MNLYLWRAMGGSLGKRGMPLGADCVETVLPRLPDGLLQAVKNLSLKLVIHRFICVNLYFYPMAELRLRIKCIMVYAVFPILKSIKAFYYATEFHVSILPERGMKIRFRRDINNHVFRISTLTQVVDGVAKNPPYGVTAFFQDLDIPNSGPRHT
jgi:hypothetical protein